MNDNPDEINDADRSVRPKKNTVDNVVSIARSTGAAMREAGKASDAAVQEAIEQAEGGALLDSTIDGIKAQDPVSQSALAAAKRAEAKLT